MLEVYLVVREPGKTSYEFYLPWKLAHLPRPGDYISISRDERPGTQDVIVRHVWHEVQYPAIPSLPKEHHAAVTVCIQIECDLAVGPYANKDWEKKVERARANGVDVPEFNISRFSMRGEQD